MVKEGELTCYVVDRDLFLGGHDGKLFEQMNLKRKTIPDTVIFKARTELPAKNRL